MAISLPLESMTVEEKLQAMESIWEDLCQKSDNITSPPWHEEVLREREKDVSHGVENFEDWELAKKNIRKIIS